MRSQIKPIGIRKRTVLSLALVTSILALAGCGKTAFSVGPSSFDVKGPGSYLIPPKVDILMVVDDTGSMNQVYPNISSSVPIFLNGLDSQEWDYHFATIPLTTYRMPKQILASKYDSNRGDWVAPYPGAQKGALGTVDASYFTNLANYSEFIGMPDVNVAQNGLEPGLSNIQQALQLGFGTSNFLRSDALLVIFVVGNGNDTSLINFCTRTDGVTVSCSDGSASSSLSTFQSWFKSNKSNTKWYSAVASNNSSSCLGGASYVGSRYQSMASFLGGMSEDICTVNISQVLLDLSQSLQSQKNNYKMGYIMIAQDADPSTLQVTRYINGDASQSEVIPQDSTNGWTYAGMVTNVYTIVSPLQMNLASGYAIQLNGTAEFSGADTGSIQYKPMGAQNSVSD